MCGIWGIFPRYNSGLFQADLKEAKQMMLDTVQRGEHSTGIFMPEYRNPSAPPTGIKVKGGPHNIIYGPIWKEIETFMGVNAGAIIGHGRHATRGAINAKNAHPFQHEHITLVHNGTIWSGVDMSKQEVEVDSHALCVAIAEKGFAEALTDIHGAYAIIAHNAKDGCVYFARNEQRPLCLYSTDNRHYLMSDGVFLRAIMNNANKLVNNSHVVMLKENVLCRINLKSPRDIEVVEDLSKLLEEKAEKKFQAMQERKKQNQAASSTSHGGQGNKGKRGTFLTFEVLEVIPMKNGNFKYIGYTGDDLEVEFITNQSFPYVGMIGECKAHGWKLRDGEEVYFVKHRDIVWATDITPVKTGDPNVIFERPAANEETTEEEAPEGAYFLTANRKKISANVWHRRVREEGCDSCCKSFSINKPDDVILTDADELLCKRCAEYKGLWLDEENLPHNILH